MTPIRILSLDLDWFNFLPENELEDYIVKFFNHLRHSCELPPKIALMTEHQYLFPWCVSMLDSFGKKQVEMINIDEHHDFYYADEIEDFQTESVTCGNFFAFMAHEQLLSKYTWICEAGTTGGVLTQRADIMRYLSKSRSPVLRRFRKKVFVRSRSRVWDALIGKRIDGFAIIQSPDYTFNKDIVYRTVDKILGESIVIQTQNQKKSRVPWCQVGRHSAVKDFYRTELRKLPTYKKSASEHRKLIPAYEYSV